jgi:outer membrane lipoprotein SlyB
MRVYVLILFLLPCIANAAYERNVARPVDKVVFGQVDSVRYFSQTEVIHAREYGWESFIGAIAGGVIGHQFGGGHGKTAATIVGSLAGAEIARQQTQRPYRYEDQLVELLIVPEEKGQKWIDVIQDVDPNMLFVKGDKVRILYFSDGVRVDKEF